MRQAILMMQEDCTLLRRHNANAMPDGFRNQNNNSPDPLVIRYIILKELYLTVIFLKLAPDNNRH